MARVVPQPHGVKKKKIYIAVIIRVDNRLDLRVVAVCVVLRAHSRIYTHRDSLSCFLALVF